MSVSDLERGGESAVDLGAGVDEVEEDAVGITEPVLMKNGLGGQFDGDAGDGPLGPKTNVGEDCCLCERRSRYEGNGEERVGEAAVHLVRMWILPSLSVKTSMGRCSGGLGVSDWGEAAAVWLGLAEEALRASPYFFPTR